MRIVLFLFNSTTRNQLLASISIMKHSYDLTLSAILENELYTTPPLIRVVIAKLIGSKLDIPKAFKIIRDENAADFKHLRRIKTLPNGDILCIICKLGPDEDEKNELKRIENKFKDAFIFEGYQTCKVPSSAPRTDHQLKACAAIWPCKFAKSTYLNQCIEGSIFSETEKLVLKTMINEVVSFIKKEERNYQAAAVTFRCAKVYGIGLTNEEIVTCNPTKHSTMLSIDSVASNAGGGHWLESEETKELRNLVQFKLDQEKELAEHRIDAQFLPYLCTNYDIFVTEQPCFMCTMGLVQSRIRRLFYLDKKSIEQVKCKTFCYPDDAIESFLIHRDKNLNHRFEAWKISLVGL